MKITGLSTTLTPVPCPVIVLSNVPVWVPVFHPEVFPDSKSVPEIVSANAVGTPIKRADATASALEA